MMPYPLPQFAEPRSRPSTVSRSSPASTWPGSAIPRLEPTASSRWGMRNRVYRPPGQEQHPLSHSIRFAYPYVGCCGQPGGESSHREAATPRGERVQRTGGFLLGLEYLIAGLLPLLDRNDLRFLHPPIVPRRTDNNPRVNS